MPIVAIYLNILLRCILKLFYKVVLNVIPVFCDGYHGCHLYGWHYFEWERGRNKYFNTTILHQIFFPTWANGWRCRCRFILKYRRCPKACTLQHTQWPIFFTSFCFMLWRYHLQLYLFKPKRSWYTHRESMLMCMYFMFTR